jgi:hypothetical protein
MKKQALTLVGVLSLLLAAGSAFAQSGQVRANVPFDFVVNKVTLPAGAYSITTEGGGNEILVIRGLENHSVRLANANAVETLKAPTQSKLVFRRYGNRYFLSQVWSVNSDRGMEIPKSSLESEIALDSTAQKVILYASAR